MKTLRRLVAVGLLMGSYHVGMAQSNTAPSFGSHAEKQAWIKANPEKPGSTRKEVTAEEKQAWKAANPAQKESNKQISKKIALSNTKIATAVPAKEERFSSDAKKEDWKKANSTKK